MLLLISFWAEGKTYEKPDRICSIVFPGAGLAETVFAPRVDYPTTNPFFLAVGDLNNDSNQDLVVANWSEDTITVFLGSGDGTSPVSFLPGQRPNIQQRQVRLPVSPEAQCGLPHCSAANVFAKNSRFFALGLILSRSPLPCPC